MELTGARHICRGEAEVKPISAPRNLRFLLFYHHVLQSNTLCFDHFQDAYRLTTFALDFRPSP